MLWIKPKENDKKITLISLMPDNTQNKCTHTTRLQNNMNETNHELVENNRVPFLLLTRTLLHLKC